MSVKYFCDVCDKNVTTNEDYYIITGDKHYKSGVFHTNMTWRICAECFEKMFKDAGKHI